MLLLHLNFSKYEILSLETKNNGRILEYSKFKLIHKTKNECTLGYIKLRM